MTTEQNYFTLNNAFVYGWAYDPHDYIEEPVKCDYCNNVATHIGVYHLKGKEKYEHFCDNCLEEYLSEGNNPFKEIRKI